MVAGPGLDVEELADALVAVCDSPLGPLAGGATLRDVARADRLRGARLRAPAGRWRRPRPTRGAAALGDVAPCCGATSPRATRCVPTPTPSTPTPRWPPSCCAATSPAPSTSSCGRRVDGATRFLTVDYKTNWLGEVGAPLTADDYRPAVLDEAMGHSDYPLQALLYTVVLHRFLRWRLPDYDPECHLGGVLYLYLRGMCGPETPLVDGSPCGVFSWRPPVALVDGAVRPARRRSRRLAAVTA